MTTFRFADKANVKQVEGSPNLLIGELDMPLTASNIRQAWTFLSKNEHQYIMGWEEIPRQKRVFAVLDSQTRQPKSMVFLHLVDFNPANPKRAPPWNLDFIATCPDARNMGLATLLLEETQSRFTDVLAFTCNAGADRLFARCNFHIQRFHVGGFGMADIQVWEKL